MNSRSEYAEALKEQREHLATCEFCGIQGIYGVGIVDTDWHDPVTGRDTIRLGCKDVYACLERVANQ